MGLPIDTSRMQFTAMSPARPGAAYAELADGTSKFVPGQQGIDRATGLPVWEIDVVAPADEDDERGRMTTATVKVVAATAPDVAVLGPVAFDRLEVRATVSRRDGKLALYWSARGASAVRNGKPAPAPAAS